jgi:hypothetical protein
VRRSAGGEKRSNDETGENTMDHVFLRFSDDFAQVAASFGG